MMLFLFLQSCCLVVYNNNIVMNIMCPFFLLCLPSRFSSVSVVFDLSATLSDATSVPPMLFPVDCARSDCLLSYQCLVYEAHGTKQAF